MESPNSCGGLSRRSIRSERASCTGGEGRSPHPGPLLRGFSFKVLLGAFMFPLLAPAFGLRSLVAMHVIGDGQQRRKPRAWPERVEMRAFAAERVRVFASVVSQSYREH